MPSNKFRPLALILLLIATTACAQNPPENATTASVREFVGERMPERFRNDVMVLGTAHLGGYRDDLKPGALDATLEALARFAPTRIAVESLPADEIALLAEHAEHDPAARELMTMYGGRALENGRKVQAVLGMNRVVAEREAATLSEKGEALTEAEHARLAALFVAAYDWPSAVLQWAWLPDTARAENTLVPAEVRTRLDASLASMNEIYSLAVPLAKRMKLQRLDSIDSQYEGVRTLSLPSDALEALFSNPARNNWQLPEVVAKEDRVREDAFAAGDLLPWFLYLNSRAYMAHDVRQWFWLFDANNASGLDRFRYAMWELRNQRIVANVLNASAATWPERVLVLIGSAHKLYLDDALDHVLTVRPRQLAEFAER